MRIDAIRPILSFVPEWVSFIEVKIMRLKCSILAALIVASCSLTASGCIEDPSQVQPPSFSDTSSPQYDVATDADHASDSTTTADSNNDTDGNTGSDADAATGDDVQDELDGAAPDGETLPETCDEPLALGIEPPIFLWSFESVEPYVGELPIDQMSPGPTHIAPCSLSGCDAPVYLAGPFRSMPGRFGKGLALDGSAGFGAIAHHPDMLINEGTIAFWFNMPAPGENISRGLFSKDAVGYADGGHILFTAQDGRLIVRIQRHDGYSPEGFSRFFMRSDQLLVPNQWHHALFTFDAHRRVLYLDGVEVAAHEDGYLWGLGTHGLGGDSLPAELPTLAGNHEAVTLGASNWHSNTKTLSTINAYNPVVIDEVAIYDRTLTAREITLLQRARLVNAGRRLEVSVDMPSDTSNPVLIIPGHLLRSGDDPFDAFDASTIGRALDPWVENVPSRVIVNPGEDEELHLGLKAGLFGDRTTIPIEVAPCQFIDLDLHWRGPPGAMPAFEMHPVDLQAQMSFPCSRITAMVPVPSDRGWDLWVALRHCDTNASTLVRLKDLHNEIAGPRPNTEDQWAAYGPVQIGALARIEAGVAIGVSDPTTGGFRFCPDPQGCADTGRFWPEEHTCRMGRAISSPGLSTVFVPCEGTRHSFGLTIPSGTPAPWLVREFWDAYNPGVRAATPFEAPGVTPGGGLTLVGRMGNQLELMRYFELNGANSSPRDTLIYDRSDAGTFRGIAAGDVDFDGVDDYLLTFRDKNTYLGITEANSSIHWLSLAGQYSGRPRKDVSFEPVAADFSGDGRANFIAAEGGNHLTLVAAAMGNTSPFVHQLILSNVMCRNGDEVSACTFPTGVLYIDVLDVDGDGRQDLLIATSGEATGVGASAPRLYLLRNLGK